MARQEHPPRTILEIVSPHLKSTDSLGKALTEAARLAEARVTYDYVADAVTPFLGEWRFARTENKTIVHVRSASSKPVEVEGVPCEFTIAELGQEVGYELYLPNLFIIDAHILGSTKRLFSIGQAGSYKRQERLVTQGQFSDVKNTVDFVRPHLTRSE